VKYSQLLPIGIAIIFGPPVGFGFLVAHFHGAWPAIGTGIVSLVVILLIAYYWVMKHTKGKKDGQG